MTNKDRKRRGAILATLKEMMRLVTANAGEHVCFRRSCATCEERRRRWGEAIDWVAERTR